MRQQTRPLKEPAEKVVQDIRRATRKHYSAEEKIRIVLEGLRGEDSIAELCRREGIPAGSVGPVLGPPPTRRGRCPPQSPTPGFGEKYWSLSGFPSHSLESGGGAFLTIIFGQIFAYSAFSDSHFSSPGSVSGSIASTGHSGTQTPQSMHSSGWMTSMFSPS